MIGDPVCGILEIVGSVDLASSQLAGWRRAEFSEWKLGAPHMYPPYFDHRRDAISELPMLATRFRDRRGLFLFFTFRPQGSLGKHFPSRDVPPHHSWGWLMNPDGDPRFYKGPRVPCPPRPVDSRDRSQSARRKGKGKGDARSDPSDDEGLGEKGASSILEIPPRDSRALSLFPYL